MLMHTQWFKSDSSNCIIGWFLCEFCISIPMGYYKQVNEQVLRAFILVDFTNFFNKTFIFLFILLLQGGSKSGSNVMKRLVTGGGDNLVKIWK